MIAAIFLVIFRDILSDNTLQNQDKYKDKNFLTYLLACVYAIKYQKQAVEYLISSFLLRLLFGQNLVKRQQRKLL